MKILAIETSCDETAIAVLEAKGSGEKPVFKIFSNIVSSQIKIHRPFGGVVPNLAQREHQKNLVPILKQALREINSFPKKRAHSDFLALNPLFGGSDASQKSKRARFLYFSSKQISRAKKQISKILEREPELLAKLEKEIFKIVPPDIDAIAVTYGPGLEPALWVGVNFAKALAVLWKKPLIAVNHLEGHIYGNWLENKKPKFPLLALIVSGGHTELVLIKKHLDYKILGETRDDAAGEAFDKVAKMLGLGYPGGPEISKLALDGNPTSIKFPRPMINSGDFDFSFSGLKTAVLYKLQENSENEIFRRTNRQIFETRRSPLGLSAKKFADLRADMSASFEQAVVDVLVSKTERALKKYKVRSLVVGGGVSANKKLRASLEKNIRAEFPKISLFLSPLWLTGDNASMIAVAAHFKARAKKFSKPGAIRAQGGLKLT